MCPACITTAAFIAVGATSGGGLTALAVKKLRAKKDAKTTDQHPKPQPKSTKEKSS